MNESASPVIRELAQEMQVVPVAVGQRFDCVGLSVLDVGPLVSVGKLVLHRLLFFEPALPARCFREVLRQVVVQLVSVKT